MSCYLARHHLSPASARLLPIGLASGFNIQNNQESQAIQLSNLLKKASGDARFDYLTTLAIAALDR